MVILSNNNKYFGSIESPILENVSLYPGKEIPKNVLSQPHGILIGSDKNYYVANTNFNKISVFNSDWEEINSIGKPPKSVDKKLGELMFPVDVAINPEGYVIVSDCKNEFDDQLGSLEIFNQSYQPFMSIPLSRGIPVGLDFNTKKDLIVGKRFDNAIEIYDLSNIAEKKVTKKKSIDLKSDYLSDLQVDQENNMIVSFWALSELHWINSNGEIYKRIGYALDDIDDEEIINYPLGICLDEKNNVFVIEEIGDIKQFSPGGELIWTPAFSWYGLSCLTIDNEGKLYVTDTIHNVILVLSQTDKPELPPEEEPEKSEASFALQLQKEEVKEGDTVLVNLQAEKLDKISTIDISLKFSKDTLYHNSLFHKIMLSEFSANQGASLTVNKVTDDSIDVTINAKKEELISGTGTLLSIDFKATTHGIGEVKLDRLTLKNSDGKEIQYLSKKDLQFTILEVDTTPPPLKIKPIPDEVYDPILQIEGETESGAIVRVNQKDVTVNPDGTFSATVELIKGVNKIVIVATDKAGNESTQTITVTLKDRTIIKLGVGSKLIIINEVPSPLDSEPFIDKTSGRTMVPIRAISEAIGAEVKFDPKDQSITISLKPIILVLWIGKPKALIDGVEVPIDPQKPLSPMIVKGRTFLPIRFVAESFDFKVDWDPKTQGITLTYPNPVRNKNFKYLFSMECGKNES